MAKAVCRPVGLFVTAKNLNAACCLTLLAPRVGLEPLSGTSAEQQATHILPWWDLRVERYQGQSGSMGERAEVRVGPQVRRTPWAVGERLPSFGELVRLCRVADSPVQSQGAICLPRLVGPHDLFLHDVLVRQQPQKAQLGKAAERELCPLKTAEPLPRYSMMGVPFRGEGNPDVDVRQVGHQSRNATGLALPAAVSGLLASLPRDRHPCRKCLIRGCLEPPFSRLRR